jgi:cytidine deaminase
LGSIPITRSIHLMSGRAADELVALARLTSARAHAPYSGIHVGAAIRSAAGSTYSGTNVENASYPLGNCAETSAIAAGIAAEGARFRIAETAVWAVDRDGQAIAISPCGGCRQRIREFAVDGRVLVHFPWHGGELRAAAVDELLPYAFELPSSLSGR